MARIKPHSAISTSEMGLTQILRADGGETAHLPEFSSHAGVDQFFAKRETELREKEFLFG